MKRALIAVAVVLAAPGLRAQGYRLRLDNRAQSVSFRGVTLDSIPASDTVSGPGGGPATPDGYAVTCGSNGYCIFYRPGAEVHAVPISSTADFLLWGLGLPGLSVHGLARGTVQAGDSGSWPVTSPAVELLEGYAEYATERVTAQLGRQNVATRLGYTGFDGGRVMLRDAGRGLDLSAFGGWGLARGFALPVTSPALNPLDEFRPQSRQLVVGAGAGWRRARFDAHLDYLREVDPSTRYFVSERGAFDLAVRPLPGWSLTGGADYDFAAGLWGSADVALRYEDPTGRIAAEIGARRYRPHFDLWTIWGAFSPVPYGAVDLSVSASPIRALRLRATGERYRYDDAAASTPLFDAKTDGWRYGWGATYTLAPRWSFDGGYHAEFGPGASSRGFDATVTFAARERLDLSAYGSTLDRPLEFRYDQSSLRAFGLTADARPASWIRVQLDAGRYAEDRRRPDAAAFSWNQVRAALRVILLFGSEADLAGVPPAVRGMPQAGTP